MFLFVWDRGRWRRPAAEPGYRGHGLTVMRQCTERLSIHRGLHGTAVAMVSTPVPDVPTGAGPAPRPRIARRATPGRRLPFLPPAGERATGERRRHRTVILRRAGELRSDSAFHVTGAERAWRRAQALMHTSTRLITESHHIHAGRQAADEAA